MGKGLGGAGVGFPEKEMRQYEGTVLGGGRPLHVYSKGGEGPCIVLPAAGEPEG